MCFTPWENIDHVFSYHEEFLNFGIRRILCSSHAISDPALLEDLPRALSGFFHQKEIFCLQYGTPEPLLLSLLYFSLSFGPPTHEFLRDKIQRLAKGLHSYLFDVIRRAMFSTPIGEFIASTSFCTMGKSLIRVDGDGNSICSGDNILFCRLICSSAVDLDTLNIFFEIQTAPTDLCMLPIRLSDLNQNQYRWQMFENALEGDIRVSE